MLAIINSIPTIPLFCPYLSLFTENKSTSTKPDAMRPGHSCHRFSCPICFPHAHTSKYLPAPLSHPWKHQFFQQLWVGSYGIANASHPPVNALPLQDDSNARATALIPPVESYANLPQNPLIIHQHSTSQSFVSRSDFPMYSVYQTKLNWATTHHIHPHTSVNLYSFLQSPTIANTEPKVWSLTHARNTGGRSNCRTI